VRAAPRGVAVPGALDGQQVEVHAAHEGAVLLSECATRSRVAARGIASEALADHGATRRAGERRASTPAPERPVDPVA